MRTDLESIISHSGDAKEQLAKVGTVTKVDGQEGHVLVKLRPDCDPDDVFDSDFLLVEINGGIVPMRMDSVTRRGDRSATVALANIQSVSQAQIVVGCDVFASVGDDDAEDDDDAEGSLVGYEVVDQTLGHIGVITDIDDTVAANPLFVVDAMSGEILIPAAEDFVVAVDDESKTLTLNLPEGLVNLDDAAEA